VWLACELTGYDWRKYIPNYFSILLWLNGFISENDMKQIYNSTGKRFTDWSSIEEFASRATATG